MIFVAKVEPVNYVSSQVPVPGLHLPHSGLSEDCRHNNHLTSPHRAKNKARRSNPRRALPTLLKDALLYMNPVTSKAKSLSSRTVCVSLGRAGGELDDELYLRHVLGAMMTATNSAKSDGPSLLHAVALLTDLPEQRLARGQVGTIVEELDETTLLVEFSDDEGRAYAIVPCPRADLLVLHYVPEAA